MWEKLIANNEIKDWVIAIGLVLGIAFVLRIIRGILHKRLQVLAKKTSNEIDDLLSELIDQIKWFTLIFISLYIGQLILTLPAVVELIIEKLLIVILLLQGAIWGSTLISFWLTRYKRVKMEEDAASVTTFTALGFIARIIMWSVILLLVLDNLGVDITTLVAGLGVGGIAVALAVQNVLGDLFASLSIVLDKPFVIGDFIIVDNYLGTIEHIGLKTTRIRSLSGEQLVFSNNDLLGSRIRNYKRMYERRVVFSLGVIYQTPYEKLEAIPRMIKDVIEKQEQTRFDRAHFKEYGNSALIFEVVYWVLLADYNVYMDIQQAINLEIFKRFTEEGIEFAYPTQTLFISKEESSDN